MKNQSIAFIGGGNMARSLIGGLVADGYDPANIRVADPDAQQRQTLAEYAGVQVYPDNSAAAADADVVLLAVKPQILKAVTSELATQLQQQDCLIITIAAGIRTSTLSHWLGGESPIVRAMPNIAALVKSGATALYANQRVNRAQRDVAEFIMRAVGLALWLDDEAQMDAVTALSGSGPAYFLLVMEAMENAGCELGLPRQTAQLLTMQTAIGTAKMALETSEDAATLRRHVTSPGGTTERAIEVLEAGKLAALFEQALKAAHQRAVELATILGEEAHG